MPAYTEIAENLDRPVPLNPKPELAANSPEAETRGKRQVWDHRGCLCCKSGASERAGCGVSGLAFSEGPYG